MTGQDGKSRTEYRLPEFLAFQTVLTMGWDLPDQFNVTEAEAAELAADVVKQLSLGVKWQVFESEQD